ncbi:MAG: AMP-binding protein, partial [Gammaproteobacteria bacterium]
MTIRTLLDQMAETRCDAICLFSPEEKRDLSFAKLRQRAAALACRLLGLGFGKGDKIALLRDNGLCATDVLFGARYGGLVPVPLNANAAKSELAYVLNHSGSKAILVSGEYHEPVNEVRAEIARPIAILAVDTERGFDWGEPENPNAQLPAVDEDDQALLPFTSGSTGKPKGVLLSHRSLLAGAANTVLAHQLGQHDRPLCVLPLYHMNALTITLLPTLLSGGCVVLPRRFNTNSFWNWVTEYRCTWFALVPTLISHLLQWTDPVRTGAD